MTMDDKQASIQADMQADAGSIAIVGIAGHFPAARSPADFWKLLRDGREATEWPDDEALRAAGVADSLLADPNYVRATLVLPDMECFDAEFFGFSKRDAAVLDPQHRHFLECAWEALEDAGHMPEDFAGAIGVFGGCGMQSYLPYNLLSNPDLVRSMGLFLLRHTGNDKDFLCSRVSYLLDLKGPSVSVQTACSTSLVAVHMAAQSLLSGECDMALAGGVSIELPHRQGYRFAEGEILAPDGHCRAFDDDAAGTLFGSGAAMVVLRRLEDALRDRDNIYAVIRGSAVNNDGSRKAGYLAPSVDGQASAAAEALAVAGVAPGSVQYIEAHGTGTPVGDPIELAALSQAYGEGGKGFCGIGSAKTNIGHLDTAAGAAGLIKVALAMRHGLIPATLNFSKPNSRIRIDDTPFQVVAQARAWPRGAQPRRAAVNSLGVGGTNAHVVVEEPPLVRQDERTQRWHVLPLSARTPAALDRLKAKWADFLADPTPGFSLADAAYTLQAGRRAFAHRSVVVAKDADSLRAALTTKGHARTATAQAKGDAPRVVFMFPGGGAHFPGAGRDLLAEPAFRSAVDECFALLPSDAPPGLRALMFERDAADAQAARTLQQPGNAIPALFILEYAVARLWQAWGVQPAALVGHSAGEYAAACIAGVMRLEDALAIVTLRGQLFEIAPKGGMLAVDMTEGALRPVAEQCGLDIAAVNAPDLCIASGATDALARLEAQLAAQGVEARRVHIDVAAHSRLLDGVLDRFRERVARMRFSPPQIPIVSARTGQHADAAVLCDPEYWVRHLREPVRFADALARVTADGETVLLEAGPGQGLGALARQNGLAAKHGILASTGKAQEQQDDLAVMLTAAGALWTRGVVPDWRALRGGADGHRISLPTYAFERQRHWIEPGIRTVESTAPAPRPQAVEAPRIERLPFDAWFAAPQWQPMPLPDLAATPGERWLVFGSRAHLPTEVAAQARASGANVTLVLRDEAFQRLDDSTFAMAPGDESHYTQLLQALDAQGGLPQRIVHLWSLDTIPGTGTRPLADQALAFDSLMLLARAIQSLDLAGETRLTVVTAGSQSVAGEAAPHPGRALALGACRVIPRELPQVRARVVDFAPRDLTNGVGAARILREAQDGGDDDLVAWRDGKRYSQHVAAAAAAAAGTTPRQVLRERGAYLITGGLGDLALDLADWLARTHRARLALVSRRTVPPQASWRALAASGDHSPQVRLVRRLLAIQDAGAELLVLSADAADRAAMARVVAQCRARFGALHGVFHAAGALDDAPIATKTRESVDRVLSAKAAGAQVLHELLPPGDLDVFAVFSSTSTLLGAPGQVDYAAANTFLDALAASRSDGLAIRWGVWGDRGMAARAYGRHAAVPVPAGAHPLLGPQVDSDDGAAFETTLDADTLWVLREHAIGGRAVLPGTGYIEMAHAAMMALHPRSAIEIRSLSFEEPMAFDTHTSRVVRTELRKRGGGYDLAVRSRSPADERWQEHVRASVSVVLAAPRALPAADGAWQPGTIAQEGAVAFGPRWHNITRLRRSAGAVTADCELPPEFAADAGTYRMHPALTDMAATCGLHLLDAAQRANRLFVPLSIERIRIAAPLGARVTSHAALRPGDASRLATFDVSLHAPDGRVLASLEGFSLRAVEPAAITQQAPARKAPGLAEAMLACGIRGEDAPAVFARVFGAGLRDVIVSSIDLQRLRGLMAAQVPKPMTRQATTAARSTDGAFGPVAAVIADAWRELLGVDTVAADDDFFALGGHSLAAVRLFARIRKHFGVDLPLATLFQAPTLAQLAAVVTEHAPASVAAPAPTEAPRKVSNVIPLVGRGWSPLVTICKGSAERRPLFCVHGAGGNVLNFKVISDRLGADQPFYGLQAQGVDGRLQPLASIEEMASQYVEAIRTVDPRGPYQLMGYSAGGVIALEMAQQLRRAGAEIALLGMIDTLSPVAARRKVPKWKKLWLMRHWSLDFALEWPGRRRKGKQDDAAYAQALERLARGEPLPPELTEFHLFRSFVAAQALYTPAPYDGPMLLFKATQSDTQYLGAGRTLGWDEHIGGPIRVIEVGGSHFSMMSEPGVSQLIQGIRAELGLGAAIATGPAQPGALPAGPLGAERPA